MASRWLGRWRLAVRLALLAALIALAVCYALNLGFRRPLDAHTGGGDLAPLTGITSYAQRDPAWAAQRLGGSADDLGASGCTVCCVAMALGRAGITATPADVARAAAVAGALTADGLLIWRALPWVADGRVRFAIPPLNRGTIRGLLAAGTPVIAKVALRDGFIHWVLITGVADGTWLVLDPLDPRPVAKPLSLISNDLRDIRVISRP